MAIPRNIAAAQVFQAITHLKTHGIPPGAQSTKYDLVDSEGNAWPPKAVLEIASRIATGQPLPRSDFSGGDQTNSRLRALGFEIRTKPGVKKSDLSLDDLKPEMVLSNDDLVQIFSVGNAGGMRWSSALNALVIVADQTKALYNDRWDGVVLYYTGMGRIGDQPLTGQNLRLAQQPQTNISVHLFEVFEQNRYVYAGQVELGGPVETEQQPDDDGNLRNAYVFPLRLVTASRPPSPTVQQLEQVRQKRQRELTAKTMEQLKRLAAAAGKQRPGRRTVSTAQYDRNEAVAEFVKRGAQGICGLCNRPAPFETKEGPYLECHHIVHLSKRGPDSIENAVALCPNCHRKMHVMDLAEDREVLMAKAALLSS
jgi:5-methylcytosine-specific restriction protein A